MKKILFILIVILMTINNAFAVINTDESINQANQNANKVLSIFSIDTLINLIFAIFAILWTVIISKLITSKISKFSENNWENREELAWVMSRTANIAILGVWFTIALAILWVDITIFLWGLWFGIWFTLKIFLSNFIWGIIMVTQWNYHNWDLIQMWDKMWNIKKINSLFTEVVQFDWVVLFIPNVHFLENEVENFHINDKRRIDIEIKVDFDTDIVKAKKVMLQVINNFPWILKAPEADVIITHFNESSINIDLRFWINSKWEYLEMKSNVTETINLAFKQYGIKIPYPQLTLSTRMDSKINLEQIKN